MATEWRLRTAERLRTKLTKTQQREIRGLYLRVSQNIAEQAKHLPPTTSGVLRKAYLDRLQKQINEELTKLGGSLSNTITTNMLAVAIASTEDSRKFLSALGFPLQGQWSHVPGDIVESLVTGKVYEGNWSLSKSLWNTTQKTKKDINTVIAEGVAQNKSAYDIAKDLEKYVNPNARKDWSWAKVYPGTSLKVDYNAQRLARTMVSHAYQQSFVQTTQRNPFVTKYKWDSSNSGRVCKLCASRDGVLFEKDELPLDHPNGMCTYIAIMPSMVDMADRIADWALGGNDPELDDYVDYLENS